MRNAIRPRRVTRAEALRAVAADVRALRCPPGRDAIWEREYSDAIGAVVRMLQNQIAQAEGTSKLRAAAPEQGRGGGGGADC